MRRRTERPRRETFSFLGERRSDSLATSGGIFSKSPHQKNGGGASNATTHRAAPPRDLQLFGGAQERFTRDKRGDFIKIPPKIKRRRSV